MINEIRKRFPDLQRLDFYSEVICGPFGSAITSAEYQETGIPLVRISNITTEGTIDEKGLIFLSEEKSNSLNSTQVKPGDLVISQRGTLGISAVIPSTHPVWNISANLIAIRRVTNLDPTYIQLFLSSTLGALQLERNQSGQVQGKIITEDVASVQIPKVEFEHTLVSQMQAAHKAREQKLEEVDALSDSIDDYVLAELGIQIRAVEEKKCFAVYAGQIEGRLDPEYNHPKFEAYKEPKSYFALKRIKELSIDIKTGLPIRQDFRSKDGKYPYYGANGIIGYMDDYTHDGRYLVVGQDGYIGNHYVVDGKFWASNHNWVATFQEGINLECVKAFLDAWNYEYLITGGVIPKLTKEAFESISIPIPPPEIQERIADEVVRRRSEAAKLRQKAAEEWEAAKTQFETQLLTGEVS